jgi:hypothetical protein
VNFFTSTKVARVKWCVGMISYSLKWCASMISFPLNFPIMINGHNTSVNWYCFDKGVDLLFGQDFVDYHLPFLIGKDSITFHTSGQAITIPSKNTYECHVPSNIKYVVEKYVENPIKINNISRHATKHDQKVLQDTKDKIIKDCTSKF